MATLVFCCWNVRKCTLSPVLDYSNEQSSEYIICPAAAIVGDGPKAKWNCCQRWCPPVTAQVSMTRNNEKRSQRHKHCVLAAVRQSQKFFAPPQTSFLGTQDDQNLISWRWSRLSPTDRIWWRSMHAISSYRGNRPTNKHTDM